MSARINSGANPSSFTVEDPSEKLHERIVVKQAALVTAMHGFGLYALFFPSWKGLAVLTLLHFVTGCLGISVGYHRLLSHRSFETNGVLKGILALFGTLAFQGGPITWARFHRVHHAFQDQIGDPHSAVRGFLWSQIGWVFFSAPNGFTQVRFRKVVADLTESPWLDFLEKYQLPINLVAMGLGYFLIPSFRIFLWAFPLRIILLWHCTWLVNSYVHSARFKPRPEETSTIAKNSAWLAVITYGEGYHKNHHDQPGNPRFANKWYEPDLGYGVIRLLALSRLAKFRRVGH